MTLTERIQQNVARGARILDDISPNWHNDIVLEELEISDCRHCIIGQLYGSFGDWSRTSLGDYLTANELFPSDVGFDIHYVAPGEAGVLNKAWKNEILTRRNG